MTISLRIQFLATVLLLCTCWPAFSQDFPAVEVSGGYTLLHDNELMKHGSGWYASAGFNFDRWTGLMIDVGGNYSTVDVLGSQRNLRIYSYMMGPQFSIRNESQATPFVQILIGGTTRSITHVGDTDDRDLAMQLGGGVDWRFRPKVGLRVGCHFRHIFSNNLPSNGVRLETGLVFTLGKRQ
jgi:hypothetical protein